MLNIFDALEAYESIIIKITGDFDDALNTSLKGVFGEKLVKTVCESKNFKETHDSLFNQVKVDLRLPLIRLLKQIYEKNTETAVDELVDKVVNSEEYKQTIEEIKENLTKKMKEQVSDEDIKAFTFFNDLFGSEE